ncbi:Predicted 5' DNA nuclease, flap endonuclease-1-like, helix-3-turn-helix (H3TH) domain [Spirosomataceae bacterium TFI 002]|nr:Predicted 5' DNA nuclease, flap endonuclease-1-like, helix-3-turn-helix (H3TH) domain [Spirosomataceae bacterium TFI 002]
MKKELHQLDKMVSDGKILEAFDKFFHENVITWSDKKDRTTSKKEKRSFLVDFFDKMKSLDQFKFHDSIIDGNTSYSKFTFTFTNQDDERLRWHEIIRREWKDGLVVDEYYFNDSFSDLKKKIEKKSSSSKDKKKVKSSAKKGKASSKIKKDSGVAKAEGFEQLVADQKPIDNTKNTVSKSTPKAKTTKPQVAKPKVERKITVAVKTPVVKPKTVAAKEEISTTKPAVKAEQPKVEKAPVAKPETIVAKPTVARKPRAVRTPDLTLIEGIGPKIKELLGMDGITTFDQVAKSKAEDLKNIMLTRGGTRYNANNPTTWPEQAALAAAGKWEELKALKAELKNGKRE